MRARKTPAECVWDILIDSMSSNIGYHVDTLIYDEVCGGPYDELKELFHKKFEYKK